MSRLLDQFDIRAVSGGRDLLLRDQQPSG